ncbi:hypothetical protein R5R35_000409 [Gryllus longicercus]|uniref:Uncharacterized protein n=1 Tax=Gryllus longicercus TaxID=2509291 RepID=A0AAN9V8J0_9ORTH|nr:Protein of unknown function [Gryllus bimaculatus]
MPTHKMKSLYQICLDNIVFNVDRWLSIKQEQEANGIFFAISPFDILPASIEQDLLETYENTDVPPERNSYWLDQDRWRLFVTRQINRLSITECTDELSLVHIAATCRNLKYLEIRNVQEVLPYLKAVAPCLSTIVTLNFEAMAHVNSSSLKYIRNHCPNLRVLGLKSCSLNDKAVSHLKHLNMLTDLDLRDTEVTASGVCQVLKHNPQLCNLQHPDVVRALFKMHATKSWLLRVSPVTSYQLRDVEFELSCKDSPNLLSVVANVCPAIERVRVEFDARSSPHVLTALTRLEKLTELDIQCVADSGKKPWEDCPHSRTSIDTDSLFQGSIVPILEIRGKQLLTLSLEGVSHVNMEIIENTCPNIVNLGLYYNSYIQESFHVPENILAQKPFSLLRRLMFGSNSGNNNDFPPSYLEWLLANQDLEELSLSGSPLFTNELFKCAFENSNAYPKLRRLELDYCNISSEVITEFLYHCGRKSLKELSICGPFVHEQASPALCYIVCEKLDVQLEAYFYSFMKLKKRVVRYKQDLNFLW